MSQGPCEWRRDGGSARFCLWCRFETTGEIIPKPPLPATSGGRQYRVIPDESGGKEGLFALPTYLEDSSFSPLFSLFRLYALRRHESWEQRRYEIRWKITYLRGGKSPPDAATDEFLARPDCASPRRFKPAPDSIARSVPWPRGQQHAPLGHLDELPRRLFIKPEPYARERHSTI